jgi:hypothetical protein
MIKVCIEINRPVNVVWDYYTETANWIKWYGGGLKEVIPGWQKGAKLVWSLGGSSSIDEIVPQQKLRTSGAWVDKTYMFQASGNSATIVEIIESDPKGGALFNDGGAAHKAQLESNLQKLKTFIEKETAAAKSASNTEENKWWQFWKKEGQD